MSQFLADALVGAGAMYLLVLPFYGTYWLRVLRRRIDGPNARQEVAATLAIVLAWPLSLPVLLLLLSSD